MHKPLKTTLIVAALAAAVLLAYVAAGPYLAINGIRNALESQDVSALEHHVDFPTLRVNMKAHVEDYVARQGGALVESGGLLGGIGKQLARGLGGAAVDAMVTPLGIGALLQGRSMWMRAAGRTVDADIYGCATPGGPVEGRKAALRIHLALHATVTDETGQPVVAVFQRRGLRWRLSDVRFDAVPSP